jgi:hypothetical protein
MGADQHHRKPFNSEYLRPSRVDSVAQPRTSLLPDEQAFELSEQHDQSAGIAGQESPGADHPPDKGSRAWLVVAGAAHVSFAAGGFVVGRHLNAAELTRASEHMGRLSKLL